MVGWRWSVQKRRRARGLQACRRRDSRQQRAAQARAQLRTSTRDQGPRSSRSSVPRSAASFITITRHSGSRVERKPAACLVVRLRLRTPRRHCATPPGHARVHMRTFALAHTLDSDSLHIMASASLAAFTKSAMCFGLCCFATSSPTSFVQAPALRPWLYRSGLTF